MAEQYRAAGPRVLSGFWLKLAKQLLCRVNMELLP